MIQYKAVLTEYIFIEKKGINRNQQKLIGVCFQKKMEYTIKKMEMKTRKKLMNGSIWLKDKLLMYKSTKMQKINVTRL